MPVEKENNLKIRTMKGKKPNVDTSISGPKTRSNISGQKTRSNISGLLTGSNSVECVYFHTEKVLVMTHCAGCRVIHSFMPPNAVQLQHTHIHTHTHSVIAS